jgi:Bacteriophage baseplate protein W
MSFLGNGWRFPVGTQPLDGEQAGPIAMLGDDEKIAQSIWIILTTSPGERVMRADFGCGLNQMVFASLSQSTIGQVITKVKNALAQWEPRISVDSVDATPSTTETNLLLISIAYTVSITNSRFNLVYPYYLS